MVYRLTVYVKTETPVKDTMRLAQDVERTLTVRCGQRKLRGAVAWDCHPEPWDVGIMSRERIRQRRQQDLQGAVAILNKALR